MLTNQQLQNLDLVSGLSIAIRVHEQALKPPHSCKGFVQGGPGLTSLKWFSFPWSHHKFMTQSWS